MTMINTPTPTPTAPLTARPVDRTSTTRRSRLPVDGQVPQPVRQVWYDLTPRQRRNLIDYVRAMEGWDDLTAERRDQLLQAKLDRFAGENAGRVEAIRRRNAVTEAQQAAVEAKQATTAPITSDLETRADVARMHPTGYAVMCDGCGNWRTVRSGRPVARFCDQCGNSRETTRRKEQARRKAEQLKDAA